MKYRIVRHDKLNWRLQEWREGGRPVPGKPGQVSEGRWAGLDSYHSSVRQAVRALLDHAAGDALLTQEAQSVQQAIEIAERTVLDCLDRLALEPA